MNILGIETSCDETAASIVKDGRVVLSSSVSSSLHLHRRYGGIIPEIASRKQLEFIDLVVSRALDLAQITLAQIDGLAVTVQPGLIGSLLVGISWARAAAYALHKPIAQIDHIQAHLYANFLSEKESLEKKQWPSLPAIGLVVSGGHSSLFYIKDFHHFELLGQTRDDAAGEAFDKVARILGLGYPGGPIIDRLAQKTKQSKIRFPHSALPDSFDFSFSGLKTAVYYHVKKHKNLNSQMIKEIAFSFQQSVIQSLVHKSLLCCRQKKIKTLLVGGGVAANSGLRQKLLTEASTQGIEVFFPDMKWCVDNAAMVAGLGYHYLRRGPKLKGERCGKSNV